MGNDGAVKVFAFDLGQVLLEFNLSDAIERLGAHCEGGSAAVAAWLQSSEDVRRFELGAVSGAEFFEVFRRSLKYNRSFEEFKIAWSDMFRENVPMVKFAFELQRRFPVFVLSNTNEIHIEFIHRKFGFVRDFSGRVYSFEEGVAKPDARIYRRLLDRVGCQPPQVCFVDDSPANVAGAKAVGLRAVHYLNAEQAQTELLRIAREA